MWRQLIHFHKPFWTNPLSNKSWGEDSGQQKDQNGHWIKAGKREVNIHSATYEDLQFWNFFHACCLKPLLINCLAILHLQAWLFVHYGHWTAKHTTLLVITIRKRDSPSVPPTLPWGVAQQVAAKGPIGFFLQFYQSLKSCNLGVWAWVVVCEEDINQAAPNKREGEREPGRQGWGQFLRNSCSLCPVSFLCPQWSKFPSSRAGCIPHTRKPQGNSKSH